MRVAYRIIHGIDLARITKEGKELLHFSPNTRVGYWFLFEEHTLLRRKEYLGKKKKRQWEGRSGRRRGRRRVNDLCLS